MGNFYTEETDSGESYVDDAIPTGADSVPRVRALRCPVLTLRFLSGPGILKPRVVPPLFSPRLFWPMSGADAAYAHARCGPIRLTARQG